MRIKKILNNNVITFESQNGDDNIAMGKGIAFGKKVGQEIDKDLVDNIFVPDSTMKDLTSWIQNIPYLYFEISNEIVKYAELVFAKPVNSRTKLFLTDHIYGACERAKDGVYLKSALYWDVKRFYKNEFDIATYALKLIKEKTGIELDDTESVFIALNIANSMDNTSTDLYEVTKIMKEVTDIIRREFMVEIDEETISYYRFINHLKYFANRIITGKTYNEEEDDLLNIIKSKYINSYNVTEKISQYLEENYSHKLSNQEKLYLTIHIQRIIYRTGE